MQLSGVGVWLGGFGLPATTERRVAREIERLGFSALWFGEAPGGKEAFTRATTLLAATESLVVATGIASIWGRDPVVTSAGIRTISEAFPGRFVAGLGVSHPQVVEARGQRYEAPLARLRDFLATMAATEHRSPEPSSSPTVVIAALRSRMLGLARDAADGAHPYFVPVEHTRRARAVLGPGPLLAPELAVVLETDPTVARRLARAHAGGFYLSASNYVENLRWLGFGDDDLAAGGSDELIDAVVAWGDEEAIATRIRRHLDAGADHVCLQPVTTDEPFGGPVDRALDVLSRLAPALRAAGLLTT